MTSLVGHTRPIEDTGYPTKEYLPISLIRTDGGTQPRAGLNPDIIQEYGEAMAEGTKFPPVTVFYDGKSYYLADGYHRFEAAKIIGISTITVDLYQGTRRDAVLYSAGANAAHGLRRSNADKRRAVTTLLTDPEWSVWSDNTIAKQCGVSNGFVSRLRHEIIPTLYDTKLDRKGSDGRTRNVANIGRSKPPASSPVSKAKTGADPEATLKALPPFLPASPQEETSPPPVTIDVCAETVPTSDPETDQLGRGLEGQDPKESLTISAPHKTSGSSNPPLEPDRKPFPEDSSAGTLRVVNVEYSEFQPLAQAQAVEVVLRLRIEGESTRVLPLLFERMMDYPRFMQEVLCPRLSDLLQTVIHKVGSA